MDKNLGYEVISEKQSKLEIVRPDFFFSLMQKKLIFFGFFLIPLKTFSQDHN